MARTATTANGIPLWPKDALRISLGIIWLIDAVLKWLPAFRSGYMATIMGQAQGQPGWLKGWFTFWINLRHPRAIFSAYLVAAVETLIAAALGAELARKITYISAAVFSLLAWATAEVSWWRRVAEVRRPGQRVATAALVNTCDPAVVPQPRPATPAASTPAVPAWKETRPPQTVTCQRATTWPDQARP
jgi:uncharacterized membrane protein YphA (DoxX/SURF4 family)